MRKIIIAVIIVATALSAADWGGLVEDDSLRAKLERNLENAGDNREALEIAIVGADPKIRPGLTFLLANSPRASIVAYNTDSLLEEVRFAYAAREKYPWGREIPEELFLHYVLPNQVSQEQMTYYRKYFMEQFEEILDTLETGSEAAIAINYWCGQRVGFKQTQRQDQGVFQTLSAGYGRCEEMMIVYVSALRAAGIPAREAWTPYWAHCDNNHAWTELWADSNWHFAGSCEPRPTLNNAWFNKSAKRAIVIMSSAFGVPETDELMYRERNHYSIINSTPYYIENPAELIVETERESTDVFLSVFNFGAQRPIMRLNTGDSTSVMFTIGRGSFIIYAGDDGSFVSGVVTTKYGERTERTLVPVEGGSLPEDEFWLRIPSQ